MRHLRRFLLNLLTCASAFACVLAIVWWVGLCRGGMFDKRRYYNPPVFEAEWLGVPMWLAVGATALLPVTRFVIYVRHRLDDPASVAAENLCPACGYDCRATPDRCPECGRSVAG